jgi:hypothetical protein
MAAVPHWFKKAAHTVYRWLMKVARYAHLVLSMFGLLVLLFFGFTGLILNHPDWFNQDEPQERKEKGKLPAELLREPVDKLLVVEYLRKEYAITLPLDQGDDQDRKKGFEVDENQIRVYFKAPGREVHVTIERKGDDPPPPDDNVIKEGNEGKGDDQLDKEKEKDRDAQPPRKAGDMEVVFLTYNLAGRLADLHRGRASHRDPGEVWPWVIDGAAVLLVCLGLTGLTLWASLKTRRWLGLGALSLGTGVLLAVYFWLVP